MKKAEIEMNDEPYQELLQENEKTVLEAGETQALLDEESDACSERNAANITKVKTALGLGLIPEFDRAFRMNSRNDFPTDESIAAYLEYVSVLCQWETTSQALALYESVLEEISELGTVEGEARAIQDMEMEPMYRVYLYELREKSKEQLRAVKMIRKELIQSHGLKLPRPYRKVAVPRV